MKIYFAHPISEYGTEFQASVIKELASSWHEVESPDAPRHQEGYRQHGMAYFEGLVAGCDALAFLRFPDGTIGAGVAKEIAAAAKAGKPIFEVDTHQGRIYVSAAAPNPQPVLSVEHTRLKLGRLADADAALGDALSNKLKETHRPRE